MSGERQRDIHKHGGEQLTLPPTTLQRLYVPDHGLTLSAEMGTALRAAYAGAHVIRNKLGETQEIIRKGVGDLVSEVDFEAERGMISVLIAESPNAMIITEESRPDARPSGAWTWIGDPLDATSAYLFRAGPQYPAVLLAGMKEDVLELGVAIFPLTGECFYAQRGKGAFKDGKPLQFVDEDVLLSDAWVDMNQYVDAVYETSVFEQLRARLRSQHGAPAVTNYMPHSGIALRVIERQTELGAVIHDNNPKKVKQAPWDIAAVLTIVTEAGGTFKTLSGADVDPFVATPMIVSRSRKLADAIIELAAK